MSTDTQQQAMTALQQNLYLWTKLERKPGTPEVEDSTKNGMRVMTFNAFPEAPVGAVRADVHFLLVGLTEGAPSKDEFLDAVRAAFGRGAFDLEMGAKDLAGGPSYITLGGWLGSQDLALRFIGIVELLGIADAITPAMVHMSGPEADEMAGMGMVMLGPWQGWAE